MNFTLHNMMSCDGFTTDIGGGCTMAWVGMVILFFIIALVRKWIGEEMGIGFNFWAGIVGGYGAYIIIISIFGSMTWALIAGVIGMAIGGFLLGIFMGDEYE